MSLLVRERGSGEPAKGTPGRLAPSRGEVKARRAQSGEATEGDQLRRTTRSVFAGSNRPVRTIAHSTRQAPRVARSQYVWHRKVPQNFAFNVVRATLIRRGKYGV